MSEEKKYVCSQAGARRLMKEVGVKLASKEAVEELQGFMEEKMKQITKKAKAVAADDKRSTVRDDDVLAALSDK